MPRRNIVDLGRAAIVLPLDHNGREEIAATLLAEEAEKRSGIRWEISTSWPEAPVIIVLATRDQPEVAGHRPPERHGDELPEQKPEGYRILAVENETQTVLWVIGADRRGLLFGVGKLLRKLGLAPGSAKLELPLDIATSPTYPIRGHQLGYRPTANSYDAWSPEQYEEYIRELLIFGTNCVENIPFPEDSTNELMKLPRREMNVRISQICEKYDLDYWVWTPASLDLSNQELRQREIEKHEEFYRACPRLDGVFVPGGDPGGNHPRHVMPFLKELSTRLKRYHPRAGVWFSLQKFNREEIEYFFDYLEREKPDWLEGVVSGPSSPPIGWTRERLPKRYRHRHYPDITHTVRCQYPVLWWDQAFALTLGREASNPQPEYYAKIHNRLAPHTDGFLSYSDGAHDDINKIVFTRLAWDPDTPVREVIEEYCRFFFGPTVAREAADGIFALERNWIGPLRDNEEIEETLLHWKALEEGHPELQKNWRWQLCLLRAYYDAYTRRRLIYEQNLERQAMTTLGDLSEGPEKAMDAALKTVFKAESERIARDLRERIEELCDDLFKSLGLQTSVPRYGASGYERGCVLDFVDYPLNNRWWLEDEFKRIRGMSDEAEKVERLRIIRTWEKPDAGFYDDVGNIAKSPHVQRGLELPTYAWWDNGFSRARLSSQVYMSRPTLRYEGLDPDATYMIRVAGYGEALLEVDGERLEPTRYDRAPGGFKEFPIPKRFTEKGWIEVSFADPREENINWRHRSRISDVWLLKG